MRFIIIAAIAAAILAGCTTYEPTTGERIPNRTGTGAIVGAVGGAGVGTLAGGNDRRNAIVGAGIGAIAGALIGNYMDRQQAALRAQLPPEVDVRRVSEDELLLDFPADITFDFDRADVKSTFLPTIRSVARTLGEYQSTYVDVVGHADSTGADDYNLQLSERRAMAVGSVLINNGVQRERLVASGRGESDPIADNSTAAGRAENRRVEIRLKAVRA
ncbi:MAG: OmpA family protein [Hyphomonadaceae bacterium]|nr:OmpA family protein [Hyphomonadaceae bacterium]